ncbi:hypothetical protein ABIB38_004268 [Massilia sp. UYP11]|uniref:hypothetical protein n=1 Tax=Massilia sp. UYP11 TaxID=1756385 RepID=UPI003D248DF7
MIDDNFAQWTKELLDEERRNGKATNVLQICVENFDVWENELIPLLRRNGKPWYRSIVEMLHKNGNTNANEAMIQKYFSRIRKKKGLTGQKASIASSLTQTRSVDVVPSPVAVSHQVAPVEAVETQVLPHQIQAVRHTPPKPAIDQEHAHVFAKTSLTPAVDFEDLREEEDRWKREAQEGWVAEWTGVDEYVWLGFLEKINEYNRYNNPKWTVSGNHTKFKNELGTEQQKNVFDLLKRKVVVQRKI